MVFYLLSQIPFALANCSSTFSPPLLLQQLDPVVDIKLDGSPVSLVAHQQGAEFQAAFTVRLRGDTQVQEVLLEVRLHSYALRLGPGSLQDAAFSCANV